MSFSDEDTENQINYGDVEPHTQLPALQPLGPLQPLGGIDPLPPHPQLPRFGSLPEMNVRDDSMFDESQSERQSISSIDSANELNELDYDYNYPSDYYDVDSGVIGLELYGQGLGQESGPRLESPEQSFYSGESPGPRRRRWTDFNVDDVSNSELMDILDVSDSDNFVSDWEALVFNLESDFDSDSDHTFVSGTIPSVPSYSSFDSTLPPEPSAPELLDSDTESPEPTAPPMSEYDRRRDEVAIDIDPYVRYIIECKECRRPYGLDYWVCRCRHELGVICQECLKGVVLQKHREQVEMLDFSGLVPNCDDCGYPFSGISLVFRRSWQILVKNTFGIRWEKMIAALILPGLTCLFIHFILRFILIKNNVVNDYYWPLRALNLGFWGFVYFCLICPLAFFCMNYTPEDWDAKVAHDIKLNSYAVKRVAGQ